MNLRELTLVKEILFLLLARRVLIFDRFLDSLIDDDDGGCRSSISRILASRLNSLALLASAIPGQTPRSFQYTRYSFNSL